MIAPAWMLSAKALPWKLIGTGLLLLAICGLLVDRHFTRAALADVRSENVTLKANVRTLETDLAAKEQASIERANDTTRIDQMKKDLTDAIKHVPPGAAPGPATVALGCERLRRAGTSPDRLPAACRSQGGR